MSWKRKKIVEQMRGIFDRPSSVTRKAEYLLHLGSIEESDFLGAALHKEATFGNKRALKKVLHSAICADYPNDLGQTPLFCACARNNETTALILLQYGANPNEKCLNGMTPTHAVCYIGNIRLLGKLIEAGGDLRLHDNEGKSMRDWARQNPDLRQRSKMLEFLDKTHVFAMTYSGDAVSVDKFTRYARRPYKQTSLMEIMKMRTGSDSSLENLRRVQSMGFGKVYLGNDHNGGIISVVPLISEATLFVRNEVKFDSGYSTFMEEMEWINLLVSVKQVKQENQLEDGIDLLISDAEYLGKLRHPNILLLMAMCQSNHLYSVMLVCEHIEGATLYHFLHFTERSLPYKYQIDIITQVCAAMNFIHSQNLIHCGLSSMAVFLVTPHTTKVGNFEFMVESIKADLGKPSHVASVAQGEFLFHWMAPELMCNLAPHCSSDVYSFCCIIWEMFARETPWAGLDPQDIKQKVVEEGEPLNTDYLRLPSKLKAIIGYGLELKEEDRLNKFSLITNWLKSNTLPRFRRTHSSLLWKNKSSNFAEKASFFPLHFSDLSSSTDQEWENDNEAENWSQDQLCFTKRTKCDSLEVETNSIPESPCLNLVDIDKHDGHRGVSFLEEELLCSSESDWGDTPGPSGTIASLTSAPTNVDTVDNFKKFTRHKRYPSEGDVLVERHSSQSPSFIKPASHSNSLDLKDQVKPRNSSSMCALYERNNNGRFPAHTWEKAITLTRDFSSQPHIWKEKTASEAELFPPEYNVKKLAECFQQHMNQHKLRQAILKGSMAPRGSCPEFDSSSSSANADSAWRNLLGGCDTCSANNACKGTGIAEKDPDSDNGNLSSTPLLKSCSTPKISLEGDVTSHYVCPDFKSHEIFYATKMFRDVGTGGSMEDEDIQLCLDENKKADCKWKTSGRNKKRAETVVNLPESNGTDRGTEKTHSMFLEEIREAHSKLVQRSLRVINSQSSPGFYYHSPTVETRISALKGDVKDFNPLSNTQEHSTCRSVESSVCNDKCIQHFTPEKKEKGLAKSERENSTPEISTSTKNVSHEGNSFWNVTPISDKPGKENTLDYKTVTTVLTPEPMAAQCRLIHANFSQGGYRVGLDSDKMITSHGQKPERKTNSEISVEDAEQENQNNDNQTFDECETMDVASLEGVQNTCGQFTNSHHPVERNEENSSSHPDIKDVCSVSVPRSSSKHSIYSDEEERRFDKELENENILNGTFTITHDSQANELDDVCDKHGTDAGKSPSSDSEKLDDWMDVKLARIKDKLSHTPLRSEHGTSSSGSLHVAKDISPSSTIEEGSERCISHKGKEHNIPIIETDAEIKKGERLNEDHLLKIQSAKSVPEVDGCDFEFREFYIDDDFYSTEKIYQHTPLSQAAGLDCNISTRDHTESTLVLKSEKGTVKEKAAFFASIETLGKPPVFPRKPKQATMNPYISNGNTSQSAVVAANLEEGTSRMFVRESHSHKGPALKKSGLPLSSKGVPGLVKGLKNREGVPIKPIPKTSSSRQFSQSDPSLSVKTEGFESKSGDLEPYRSKKNEEKDDDDTLFQIDADEILNTGDADDNTLTASDNILADEKGVVVPTINPVADVRMESVDFSNSVKAGVYNRKLDSADLVNEETQTCLSSRNFKADTTYDSDSLESDKWVTEKLKSIQDKIRRRKARLRYIDNSDKEDTNDDTETLPVDLEDSDNVISPENKEETNFTQEQEASLSQYMQNSLKKYRQESSLKINSYTSKRGTDIDGDRKSQAIENKTKLSLEVTENEVLSFQSETEERNKEGLPHWQDEKQRSGHGEHRSKLSYIRKKKKLSTERSQETADTDIDHERAHEEDHSIGNKHFSSKSFWQTTYQNKESSVVREKRGRHTNAKIGAEKSGCKKSTSQLKATPREKLPSELERHFGPDTSHKNRLTYNSSGLHRREKLETTGSKRKSLRSLHQVEMETASPKWECPPTTSCRPSNQSSILHKSGNLAKHKSKEDENLKKVPSPLPRSKSKISTSHTSRSADKVISFMDMGDNGDEDVTCVNVVQPVPLKRCSVMKVKSPPREKSFGSTSEEFHQKHIQTWLERQNFTEFGSRGSLKCSDEQSITSKIMDMQNMTVKRVDSKHSIISNLRSDGNIPSGKLSTIDASLNEMSPPSRHQIQLSTAQLSNPSDDEIDQVPRRKSFLSPRQLTRAKHKLHDTRNISDSIFPAKAILEKEGYFSSHRNKSTPDLTFKRIVSPEMYSVVKYTEVEDHCLTLDLRRSSDKNKKGKNPGSKKRKEKSCFGLHRFYIPHELWSGGCQAKLNVQVSPTHPECHRVITTATDPVSGHTETLLDQTLITDKLRSTLQID